MTTIRLSQRQKERLNSASRIIAALRRTRVSQGEAVEVLAEFALRHREMLARVAADLAPPIADDPFFDPSLSFDLGPTDERTHDRILYGRR